MNFKINKMTIACGVLFLTACDNSNIESSQFNLAVTDAPTDGATTVMVEFTGVELKPKVGNPFSLNFTEVKQINLLNFQGTDAAQLIDGYTIEAGEYNWMRLKVNAEMQTMDSYIEFDTGAAYSLYIPSGSTSGLKWNKGFVAPANGTVDFTIDFDVKKSIHGTGNSGNDYIMRPVIRVVDNTVVGHIEGTVNGNLLSDPSCSATSAVYLFAEGEIADDLGSATSPQTHANVTQNNTGDWEYTLGYVLPGNYELALTCQASDDMPDSDDNISFLTSVSVTVNANETTQINF